MIKLDKRLAAAAKMVRDGGVAADIGSDHGYLACYLAQNSICTSVYACDINAEPLERTRQTIAQYGLGDKVEVLLSNGLQALNNKHIDDIIIAGMGGELIAQIIEDAQWHHEEKTRFILQPMTKAERLRTWLYKNGFKIKAEHVVSCGRFSYSVMQAEYTGYVVDVSLKFAWTGLLWDNNSCDATQYLKHVFANIKKIADGTNDSAYIALVNELKERLELNG